MRCEISTRTLVRLTACLMAVCGVLLAPGLLLAAEELPSPVEDHNTDLVVWSLITFGIFLIVLKKVAWGPLIEGLDSRESRLLKVVADAQQDRDKAVALLADYEQRLKDVQGEVDEIIAEARRDADRTKTDILAAAQQEAEVTLKRALDDIGRARDQAVAELFDHVRTNVVSATEKMLSRSLTDADDQKLIDDALAEMSAAQR
jgi:F-type H+-transporting ATPase subunit b